MTMTTKYEANLYDYNTIKMRQTGSKLVLMAGKLLNCQHCGNINYFPC